MLIALLLAAQPTPPPSPPSAPPKESIDITATMDAYLNWRACLDVLLGVPPRARQPKRAEADAAFARCRSYESKLETAVKAAFGPSQGSQAFDNFASQARAELNGTPLQR